MICSNKIKMNQNIFLIYGDNQGGNGKYTF